MRIPLIARVALGIFAAAAAPGAIAQAQCATFDVGSALGVVTSGNDICEVDDSNDVRPRLICGGRLLYPTGGKDLQFTWTAPETGLYRFSNWGGFTETVLTVTTDGSASCQSANTSNLLTCAGGQDVTTDTVHVSKGQTLLVTLDPRSTNCGYYEVHAERVRGCETDAIDVGSLVGEHPDEFSTAGNGMTRPTSCGSGVGLGANHSDEVFQWTAPETGRFVFSAESRVRGGVTIAVFEDSCDGNELACSNSGLGAGVGTTRSVGVDVVEGRSYAIVVRGREGDIDFRLAVSKDGCLIRDDLGSVMGHDVVVDRIANVVPQEDTVCGRNSRGEHYFTWTAPYSGWFTFRTDASVGEERVAIAIRDTTCNGAELSCHAPSTVGQQATVRSVRIEEGEQVVVAMVAVGIATNHDYKLNIFGVGCGDGYVKFAGVPNANEFDNGSQTFVNREVCEPGVPIATTCGEELTGALFGDVQCAVDCEMFNTDFCARECADPSTCADRAGAQKGCDAAENCMYECQPGFLDCDGDLNAPQGEPSNGCEISVDDVQNCGACGQICGTEQTCDDQSGAFECRGETTCYDDADGDGYAADGANGNLTNGNCPVGTTPQLGDCDDTDPNVNPGAHESCNGIDDNCNGDVDEESSDTLICPAGPGATGVCEQNAGGEYECVFTCESGYTDTDGSVGNGCESGPGSNPPGPGPGTDPGTDPGTGGGHSGGGVTLEEGVVIGGGRAWGACSSAGAAQGGLAGLLLLGGLVALRRRRQAA